MSFFQLEFFLALSFFRNVQKKACSNAYYIEEFLSSYGFKKLYTLLAGNLSVTGEGKRRSLLVLKAQPQEPQTPLTTRKRRPPGMTNAIQIYSVCPFIALENENMEGLSLFV